MLKVDATATPEIVGAVDVFGDEADLGCATNESGFFGAGAGCDEGEQGRAIGRGDGDPAAIDCVGDVGDDTETQLVDVELKAHFVVADVDGGIEEAQVGTFGTAALRERLYGSARVVGLLDGFGFWSQRFSLQTISPRDYSCDP